MALSTPDKSGVTLRQHLTQAGEEIEEPEPLGADYLLQWFWRLSNRRGSGMNLNPITWEAIDAWARRSGEGPEPWEIRVLERLDDAFLQEYADRSPS